MSVAVAEQRLHEIFENAKKLTGVSDVKLVVVDTKRKIASSSLNNRVVRISRLAVERLDDEALLYVLVHELIHIKLGSDAHGSRFDEEMEKLFPREKREVIESRIIMLLDA